MGSDSAHSGKMMLRTRLDRQTCWLAARRTILRQFDGPSLTAAGGSVCSGGRPSGRQFVFEEVLLQDTLTPGQLRSITKEQRKNAY